MRAMSGSAGGSSVLAVPTGTGSGPRRVPRLGCQPIDTQSDAAGVRFDNPNGTMIALDKQRNILCGNGQAGQKLGGHLVRFRQCRKPRSG